MLNIRQVNCSKIKYIELSVSKRCLQFAVNMNTKVKDNNMSDGFDDTIVSAIGNGFFKVYIPK